MALRSQSAMEYLMTYGWAIIIIAIILAALYQLGVFNPYSFSPKVASGACKIARGLVASHVTSSKVGTCNNALPQYVGQFNGATSNVLITGTRITSASGPITLTLWAKSPTMAGDRTTGALATGSYNCVTPNGFEFYAASGLLYEGIVCQDQTTGVSVPVNAWFFAAITYNGVAQVDYLGLAGSVSSISQAYNSVSMAANPNLEIGKSWNPGWDGQISNVQLYNVSLSSNEITALYREGLGGDPINTANLTGWWPLNGDAVDYSGNGNDGVATNVVFTGSWMAGYSAP